MLELGLKLNENLSWESCDEEYHSLQDQLMSSDLTALIQKPFAKDQNIILTGAVLTEAISAAYWSDTLLVYIRSLPQPSLITAKMLPVLPNGNQNG